jgi:hypothetical protein
MRVHCVKMRGIESMIKIILFSIFNWIGFLERFITSSNLYCSESSFLVSEMLPGSLGMFTVCFLGVSKMVVTVALTEDVVQEVTTQ